MSVCTCWLKTLRLFYTLFLAYPLQRWQHLHTVFYCLEKWLLTREICFEFPNWVWKKKKLLKFNELWAVIPSTTILELPLSGALSPQQLQGSNSEATVGDCECTESLPVCATRDVENSNAENSLHFYLLDKKKNLFHFHWLTFK